MNKYFHHLNTVYPNGEAILDVGEIAARIAAEALDFAQDVPSAPPREQYGSPSTPTSYTRPACTTSSTP